MVIDSAGNGLENLAKVKLQLDHCYDIGHCWTGSLVPFQTFVGDFVQFGVDTSGNTAIGGPATEWVEDGVDREIGFLFSVRLGNRSGH